MSALDTQVGGEHYRAGAIQPVQYIEANKLAFLEGCVVKRVTRHDKPTGKGRQDIEKAIHEMQLLLELRYPKEKAFECLGRRVSMKTAGHYFYGLVVGYLDDVGEVQIKWDGLEKVSSHLFDSLEVLPK